MSSACNKKVTFNPKVGVRLIPTINEYSPSARDDIWYKKDDFYLFMWRAIEILARIETNTSETHKYCVRGLEGHSRLGSISRRKNKLDAREAVFKEQDRQRNEQDKSSSDQDIADAYGQISSSCQMWAQAMGHQDQITAEAHLFEEEKGGEENEEPTEQPPRSFEVPDSKLQNETKMRTLNEASSTGPVHNYQSPPAA